MSVTVANAFGWYTAAHTAVLEASRALARLDRRPCQRVDDAAALDDPLLVLAKAKWELGDATGIGFGYRREGGTARLLDRSVEHFQRAAELADGIRISAELGEPPTRQDHGCQLEDQGTEIVFADGIPIVPAICPVVVLQGTWEQMGWQYARQLVDVYGTWLLDRVARQPVDDAAIDCLRRWEEPLHDLAPEIVAFARGVSRGAVSKGVPLDVDRAVSIWTGTTPPSPGPGGFGFPGHESGTEAAYFGLPYPPELCSGVAAWGSATRDGSLAAAATTDHDGTFQATIVAFPDEGNAFIYTPFGATGVIPNLGAWHMAGHPGINDRGLAYVHHGGAHGGGYEEGPTGYGLRRGAATVHALAHCSTAEDALTAMLDLPIGDAGAILGSAGGFWADDRGGVVIEGRGPRPRLRFGVGAPGDVPIDALYANNNFLSPESGTCGCPPEEGYEFDPAEGWRPARPSRLDSADGAAVRRAMASSSAVRNRYLYEMIRQGAGRIDTDWLTMLYRHGREPDGRTGIPQDVGGSAAHRLNAFTTILHPRSGRYSACVGPAQRSLEPNSGHGYFYVGETNEFWDLHLRGSPDQMLDRALAGAESALTAATDRMAAVDPGRRLMSMLDDAEDHLASALAPVRHGGGQDPISGLARRLRSATRAQVRARQVTSAIDPPPDSPEALAALVTASG